MRPIEPLLQVDDLNVSYADIQALREVSIKVFPKEIVGLLGPNGSGKSTLLKSILGMVQPSSGSIRYAGENLRKLAPHAIVDRGIVYIPEGRRIFPDMSVMENLELGALTRRSKERKEENLELVFELFPILKERRQQMAGTLSGGEAQMLAIARGLMAAPKLLMVDEPSVGLAPKVLSNIYDTLGEINRRGVEILLVEQNIQGLQLCNRGYVLQTGRVLLEGDPKTLSESGYMRKAYMGL